MNLKLLSTAFGGLLTGFVFSQMFGCASQEVAKDRSSKQSSQASPGARNTSAGAGLNSEHQLNSNSTSRNPSAENDEAEAKGEKEVALFQWPVDEARLSRGFLPRARKPHWGIDLAAHKGTPILAAHDGVVIYTGREFRGFGKMVMIEGGQGWATLYAHFSKITAREGQHVRRGEKIGEMGRTGHATGNHLHFEVRSDQGPVDPLIYLPRGSSVARVATKSSK